MVREAHGRAIEWHASARGAAPRPLAAKPGSWFVAESARLREEWSLATKIVCWSDWCRHCVVAEGVPEEKCVVVHPAFTPSPAYAGVEPNFESDPFTVVFLGTLCIRKGTHDLIVAVAEAAQERPVRLILAGANDLNPDMIARYSHCVDYRGFVPHCDLPRLFAEGHVLALPSYSEGFGLVQVEAMAAGLPVIRSTNSGDAARHMLEGLVVPPGDRTALAAAILQLASDRNLTRAMGDAARRRATAFGLQACSDRWRAVLNVLTG